MRAASREEGKIPGKRGADAHWSRRQSRGIVIVAKRSANGLLKACIEKACIDKGQELLDNSSAIWAIRRRTLPRAPLDPGGPGDVYATIASGGSAGDTVTEPGKDGQVRLDRDGPLARITFDRPAARNAMTWRMYEQLAAICAELRDDKRVRVALLRGAGGKAFIAGTDISQFQSFSSGEDGVAYEQTMEQVLAALETLPIPTVAVVEGWAVGGGLAIATCCDFRIATPGAKLGVPIARTLGNCLSVQNYARIIAALGTATTKRMLVLGEFVTAEEAHAAGFIMEVAAAEAIDARAAALCDRLARNAPITMRVSKEMIRRIVLSGLPESDDLVRQTYGSSDFREGVAAFVAKRDPHWTGQ